MLLLKLNSTEEVASCINSTKMSRGKDGFGKTLLYRASAQIRMVTASGTLVKRLEMSMEQRKTGGREFKVFDFYKGKRIRHAVGG